MGLAGSTPPEKGLFSLGATWRPGPPAAARWGRGGGQQNCSHGFGSRGGVLGQRWAWWQLSWGLQTDLGPQLLHEFPGSARTTEVNSPAVCRPGVRNWGVGGAKRRGCRVPSYPYSFCRFPLQSWGRPLPVSPRRPSSGSVCAHIPVPVRAQSHWGRATLMAALSSHRADSHG